MHNVLIFILPFELFIFFFIVSIHSLKTVFISESHTLFPLALSGYSERK